MMTGQIDGHAPLTDPVVALIDDDPLYIEYLRGLLAMEGLTRVEAIDARAPLFPRLGSLAADCFVIDYDLGEDNGLNVAARMIAERAEPPPLVMMTGTGSERTVIKAMRIGFVDYVSKRTLTGSELVRAIGRAVSMRREGGPSGAGKSAHVDLETGLPDRAAMFGRLEAFCGPGNRRPFSFGLIEPENIADIQAGFGVAAADRARAALINAFRRERGCAGPIGHWEGEALAWISDADTTPDRFESMVAALPELLRSDVTFDAGWARITARVGAALLPAGTHDAAEVAGLASDLLATARSNGVPSQAKVRGRDRIEGIDAPQAGTTERRRHRRMRCLKAARIVPDDRRSVVDCVVVNQSEGGLCLKTKSFFVAPERFEVEVLGSGERRQARLCWQKGQVMGIELRERVH